MNRKRVAMDVLDGSFDNNFWVIPCSGLINEQQQKQALFPLESDLVLVTRIAADGRGEGYKHVHVYTTLMAVNLCCCHCHWLGKGKTN